MSVTPAMWPISIAMVTHWWGLGTHTLAPFCIGSGYPFTTSAGATFKIHMVGWGGVELYVTVGGVWWSFVLLWVGWGGVELCVTMGGVGWSFVLPWVENFRG